MLFRMHRRRSVAQELLEDLQPVRRELLLDDRIDAVAGLRAGFAVGEDVFADHLITEVARLELQAAAEVDGAAEAVTAEAAQLLGADDDLIRRQLAAGAVELRLQLAAERLSLRRWIGGLDRRRVDERRDIG